MKKIHFATTQERLNFLRGKHTEIVPIEVESVDHEEAEKDEKENEDEVQAY